MKDILTFSHPVLMLGLLALYLYIAYLGIKSRRISEAESLPQNRSKFAFSHHRTASVWLALMVFGAILGIAVTFINNGKLFFSPHMWAGLSIILLISMAAAVVPFMQQRNSQWARNTHLIINIFVLLLLLFEGFSGVEIINKILAFKK